MPTTKSNPSPPSGSDAFREKVRSLLDEWTNDPSKTSSPVTSPTPSSSTPSPASASGATPSGSPAGPTTAPSGRGRARANRSRPQDAEKVQGMRATSGPLGMPSSASAALQSSLESKLRARMAGRGCDLYKLTWKHWDTPSQGRIYALRASVRRTSDNVSSGWPSPTVNDSKGSDYTYGNGDHDRGAAKLAGWGTPTQNEPGGTAEQALERKRAAVAAGKQLGISVTHIAHQAQLVGWATPTQRDHKDGASVGTAPINALLGRQASPEDSGPQPTGSPAPTEKPGQLNPSHSRWLMGLPGVWDECAPKSSVKSKKK